MDGSEAHTPSSSKRRHNSMEEEEEMVDTSVQYASLDLSTFLWQSPSLFDHQFSTQAKHAIFEKCYSWLWQNEQELMRQYFYPDRQRWEDSIARLLQNRRGDTLPSDQLMSDDNDVSTSSYSREICGRLFRKGEPVYRCRTCALDDTCVLCSKCFNASNHDDHDVFVSISTGSGGCCDCSDAEAWKVPLHCSLHHHSLKKKGSRVPAHIANHIRTSIHTILEFALQVFAVTPEEVSLPRNNADIVRNGQQVAAALRQLGIPTRSPPPEKRHREESSMDTDDEIYACVVWNDEAHSFVHVCETIQQALECSFEEAKKVTDTIHIRGRCVLGTSSNLEDLRNLAAPLLHINLGVTIRPARDVFREQTAALLLDWLQQIAREPLPINQDGLIRTILCEELTMPFSLPKPLTTIVRPKSEDKDKDKEKKKDKEESGDDAHVDGEDTIMVDVSSAVAEEKVQVSSSASGIGPSSSSKTALPRGDIASIDWDPVPMVEEYRRLAVEEMEFDKMMLSERSNSNWSNQEETQRMAQDIQTEFEQTLQLDYFLLYDLRLWKEVRLALRELYIATLTTEAPYKKILGKRLTRNYARLAESFLFRDREPENAIILFSVQLLTVPSIAVLLVTEYHFFGLICSTLMAFFITEQIYYLPPVERRELPTRLNCDSRAFRTRRYFNSFHDIRYILNVDLLKPTIAQTPVYLRQFLDLIALFQAMNPQVRQKDTHVEYESDMWINAFNVTVQIAKSCRCFAECFKGLSADRIQAAQATIRAVARIINYIHEWGWGTEEEAGKPPPVPATTDCKYHTITFPHVGSLDVIDYDISSRPVSFHHPLHWLLAGILDAASWVDDQVLTAAGWNAPFEEIITKFKGEQSVDGALLPVFDFPIRTLAFSAQIRAGVWVRNGFSVKNQVLHYRDITLRESLYDSDVFLLQAALVTVDQNRVLATLIDRYNLVNWFSSKAEEHPVYDSTQMLFMVEDLLNIMIYCICERASASNLSHQERIRREIVHHLSLGQLLYSELTKRLSERMAEHPEFDAILQQVANFKAPNNLSDSGHYTLREEFFDLVDPYFHHFSRNNREEAERVLKARDKSAFVKPRPLQPINGIFRSLDNIIETSVFLQMIVYTLLNARNTEKCETILDEALHLTMIAAQNSASDGFIKFAVNRSFPFDVQDYTLFDVLVLYRNDEENYKDLHPEIDYIFNLMSQRGSQETKQVVDQYLEDRARIQKEKEDGNQELSELERKKKAAKERQKNIMDMFAQAQTAFLEQNEDFYDEDEEEEADMLGNANEASNAEPQPVVMYPTGTCIVCQEDVNERSLPYGMLGLLQISNMLQDAPADSKSMDAEILSRDTTLACEWPQQLAVDEYAGRTPLSGRKTGLYASTCGHLMHIKCFESYCASIDARHTSQLQRNHPENRQRKEFTCPLCKALGNMVLPIIWKGQAETYPGPSDEESYQRFLNTDVHFIAEKLQYSIDPNRPIGFGVWNANGGNMLFAPRLPSLRGAHVESRIPSLSSILGTAAAEQQERLQHRLGPPAMLIKSAVGIIPAIEKIYGRLSSVLSTILDICGSESTKPLSSSIKYVDSLWGTLGYTIACLEIATRGQPLQEDQYTVFDQITSSQQTLLRIFCDTIIAYTHLMCQQDQPSMGSMLFQIPATKSDSSVMIQVHGLALQRMLQIFAVDPAAATQIGAIENTLYDNPPLLADDPFMILSELSMHLIPVAHADIYPFIRILFLAEISRVVAGLLPRLAESSSDGNVSIDIDDNDAPAVGRLAKFIASQLSIQQHQPSLDSKLARLLKTYALPFLRRTAVLISVRFGVTLPRPSSLRTNEFEQLLEILQLPNLTDLITHADTERLVRGWCIQLLRDDSVAAQLVLDRPTPYSLIPLARRLDTLINESMQHTCPRCNSVPTDPALCLLCGTFVCSQSFCCSEGEEGECNLHMFECGGEIGIYLLIKRCSLLLLHNENGWFLQAPYLDTHGEVDQGLRRGRPQYLNTKRYADIRKLWLQHGIPSYIARQIEATFDVGGWTTL